MSEPVSIETVRGMVGGPPLVSDWKVIDQARIDAFADVTEDHQFIHVDPEAAAKTPFGGTIAHGFLTLSMLSALIPPEFPQIEGTAMGVNFGFDRIRFIEPVRAGSRVRSHLALLAFEERRAKQFQSRWDVTVEIEEKPKPALKAEWLTLTILR